MAFKKTIITMIASAFFAGNISASAEGYINPVIPGYHPDPSVCRVGDDFYLVNSTFQYFPGVPVFHSKDLVHWEQIGNVLDRPSQLDLPTCAASGGIFAPTIRYHEGKYYMITTNINYLYQGKPGNLIVTADNPAGLWSDPVYTMGVRGIDPSLFWTEDGKCYCTYSGFRPSGIFMFEIDTKTGEVLSDNKMIWDGTGDSSPEGPHIIQKDGYYYLLIAEGGTEMGHKVTIARSKNIWGPYESNPANPILTQKSLQAMSSPIQGTGHADLVEDQNGNWWMVCLGFRTTAGKQLHTLGRETYLAPVEWKEGEWPVVNPSTSSGQAKHGMLDEEMKVPTLPAVTFAKAPIRTELSKPLGFEWVYVANPKTENYRTTGEGLEMTATPTLLDDAQNTPTTVMRRQEDVNVTVTTALTVANMHAGDAAGLTVYMDPHGHYDIAIVGQQDGSRALQLRYRLGDMLHVEKSVALSAKQKDVQLRCIADKDHYAFEYSIDGGKTFEKMGSMNTYFLATETLGGFTGMMFGMFAEGNGSKATFQWFDYDGKDKKN